ITQIEPDAALEHYAQVAKESQTWNRRATSRVASAVEDSKMKTLMEKHLKEMKALQTKVDKLTMGSSSFSSSSNSSDAKGVECMRCGDLKHPERECYKFESKKSG
ncbi:hypothetical protein LINPERHAP1_LOCUS35249, partial [Linum perenne]